MGREAECISEWGSTSAKVKVLLESAELIVRGGVRRKVPLSAIQQLRVEAGKLLFQFEAQRVSLALGEATASRWYEAITTPPPTLAKKLGVTSQSTIWLWGEPGNAALLAALAEAKEEAGSLDHLRQGDLIILCVDTMEGLARGLTRASSALDRGVPAWIIYPKGKVTRSAKRKSGRQRALLAWSISKWPQSPFH